MMVLGPWWLDEDDKLKQPLSMAELALERGDYGQCIKLLEPLIEEKQLEDKQSAQIGMILVTAYIGNAENEKATKTCKKLTKCSDKDIKQKAKDLLPILQAPSLQRPSSWSVEIPVLDKSKSKIDKLVTLTKSTQKKIPKKYHPPTGSMKSLDLGFSFLVFIVIS